MTSRQTNGISVEPCLTTLPSRMCTACNLNPREAPLPNTKSECIIFSYNYGFQASKLPLGIRHQTYVYLLHDPVNVNLTSCLPGSLLRDFSVLLVHKGSQSSNLIILDSCETSTPKQITSDLLETGEKRREMFLSLPELFRNTSGFNLSIESRALSGVHR